MTDDVVIDKQKPDQEEGSTATAAAASSTAVDAANNNNNNATKKKKRPAAAATDAALQPSRQQQQPITQEGERPQKKFYRQRAHCNPLSHNDSFTYPVRPDLIDWTASDADGGHYPGLRRSETGDDSDDDGHRRRAIVPTVLDIGCGFGGLTLALAKILPPDEVVLGMEIRAKVTEYVRLRILSHRRDNPGQYQNCSVLRTNSMKFLPNFFAKASISKLFFCFPDPHFKRKNFPRRIISERLLSEYAYVLRPDTGRLYCITDVQELHEWHVAKCAAHPLFRRLADDELKDDPCVAAMQTETEEGQKVSRAGGSKYYAVFVRICSEQAPRVNASNFFTK